MKKEFITETSIKWQALIDENGYVTKVKMTSKMPRGYYYSALNDVGVHYEELLSTGELKTNEA